MGHFDFSGSVVIGIRKGPFVMPKKFGLNEGGVERGAINSDERAGSSRAVMNVFCHFLFACARLTQNQNVEWRWCVRFGQLKEWLVDRVFGDEHGVLGLIVLCGGWICQYFDTASWNVDTDGLIYTDRLFLLQLQMFLDEHFGSADVSYSEQGMQGDNFVSLDVGEDFIKSYMTNVLS